MVALVLLALVAACGGAARNAPEDDAGRPAAWPSAESAAGVAFAKEAGTPLWWAAAGNGSLLVNYQAAGRCYYRGVSRGGTVAGWFAPTRSPCRWLVGHGSGLLGVALVQPLRRSVDLSDPGHPVRVTSDDPGRKPQAGDVYLGWCTDLFGQGDDPSLRVDPALPACAYAPRASTFYRVPTALTIDPAGRLWRSGPGNTITVSDGSRQWRSERLPAEPEWLIASPKNAAAVGLLDRRSSVYVTEDAGRSWNPLTGSLPEAARDPNVAHMLPTGQLLLGPAEGRFWRATDNHNRSFEALPAGPITTVLTGGDRLFGLAVDADDPRLRKLIWMSQDSGSTWRQVAGPDGVAPPGRAVRADRLPIPRQWSAAAVIARYRPSDVAVADNGFVLVTYGGGMVPRSAWRLYDRQDRVVAEELDGFAVSTAGDGFLLQTGQGLRFVGEDGQQAWVDWETSGRHPIAAGDVYVPDYGVYRPSQHAVFVGTATPDGTVGAVDSRGRMWALAPRHGGRTVVRFATPGQPWSSRDLGPALRPAELQGEGSTLMVVGKRDMYVSDTGGATWARVRHGASVYTGLPTFTFRPDGSIIAGDQRAGYRISYDRRTFRAASDREIHQPMIGGLFARGRRASLEISRDQVHWQPFTATAARQLLSNQSAR